MLWTQNVYSIHRCKDTTFSKLKKEFANNFLSLINILFFNNLMIQNDE